MHAVGRRAWAPLLTIAVAVGVHAVIIAALPKARPAQARSAPAAVTAALPRAPAPQFQAFAPAIAAPVVPVAPAATQAPKPTAAVHHVARKTAPARDDDATIDMRPHEDDEAPVRIATPLPVTIVTPPR